MIKSLNSYFADIAASTCVKPTQEILYEVGPHPWTANTGGNGSYRKFAKHLFETKSEILNKTRLRSCLYNYAIRRIHYYNDSNLGLVIPRALGQTMAGKPKELQSYGSMLSKAMEKGDNPDGSFWLYKGDSLPMESPDPMFGVLFGNADEQHFWLSPAIDAVKALDETPSNNVIIKSAVAGDIPIVSALKLTLNSISAAFAGMMANPHWRTSMLPNSEGIPPAFYPMASSDRAFACLTDGAVRLYVNGYISNDQQQEAMLDFFDAMADFYLLGPGYAVLNKINTTHPEMHPGELFFNPVQLLWSIDARYELLNVLGTDGRFTKLFEKLTLGLAKSTAALDYMNVNIDELTAHGMPWVCSLEGYQPKWTNDFYDLWTVPALNKLNTWMPKNRIKSFEEFYIFVLSKYKDNPTTESKSWISPE